MSTRVPYKSKTSQPKRRETIGVPSRKSLQHYDNSDKDPDPSDADSHSSHTSHSSNDSSSTDDPQDPSDPSDDDDSDNSRKRKGRKHNNKDKNYDHDSKMSKTIQDKLRLLNTLRTQMQQKHKYLGLTARPLDSKLHQFYVFYTDVNTIFDNVDLSVLIKNKLISKEEIFTMITQDMTSAYAKTFLTELQQESKNRSQVPDNHDWKKVTKNLDSYFTYIASQVFNEKEIQRLKSTLFDIPKGSLSVSQLYTKVHTIYTVSRLLAPRFACDPVNEATSSEAFMRSLNRKVENALDTKFNRFEYGFTTTGILRWFRKEGELEEQRIFPQGYTSNTDTPKNRSNVNFSALTEQESESDNDFDQSTSEDDEHAMLAYIKHKKKFQQNNRRFNNRNPKHKFNNNPVMKSLNNIEQTLQQQTLQFQQGLPNRPQPNTFPSLNKPQTSHDTRLEWFRDKRCINCGDKNCHVKVCKKPKDLEAIDKVFKEIKNKHSSKLNEIRELQEFHEQLSMLGCDDTSDSHDNSEQEQSSLHMIQRQPVNQHEPDFQ